MSKRRTAERDAQAGASGPQATDIVTPSTPQQLAEFVRHHTRAQIAATALLPGSDGPLAYLVHSFFEGRFVSRGDGTFDDLDAHAGAARPPGDCVVWANRGGGKTFLCAVATALDLLFKPGIEVRILGGSAEQSRRMHEHLRAIFEHESLSHELDGRSTDSRIRLRNGSRAEVLSHSERSVRGVRVQKLRCDEVDLFDPALWQAAQLVTRSAAPIPGPWGQTVRGVVEVLSTMHVPMGLMWEVVKQSGRAPAWTVESGALAPGVAAASDARGQRVLFKWGVIDSLERCGTSHECASCPLMPECGGRAKERTVGGHLTINDALVLKRRASKASWDSEMLCNTPSRSGCVFPEFDPALHAANVEEGSLDSGSLVAGMDFGVRCPTVMIWAWLGDDGVLTVLDEYAQTGRTLAEHLAQFDARSWGRPAWVGIDPAGTARNEQTGSSNLKAMKSVGLNPRARRVGVVQGVEQVRVLMSPASGPPRLRIHPRCAGLIESMARYHYPADRPREMVPEKDGSDHWCDALRYLVVNIGRCDWVVGQS